MKTKGVHLVGSIPLADAETVFLTVSRALGPHLVRIPDGETGARKNWIAWQYGVLSATPGVEPVDTSDRGYLRRQLVRLSGDARAVQFGSLGYADAALASFASFDQLQRDGHLPSELRFQVSLPTPLAPISVFVEPAARAIVEPAYEQALLGELRRIVDGIDHDRLAIQWDVAVELGHLEGVWPAHFADLRAGIMDRLGRIGAAVPTDIQLGYHLCYGDFGHRHFTTPKNAALLVRLANALLHLDRPLAWIHMPVPIDWTSAAAFAPLAKLALPAQTQLYLGVVHVADGIDGTRRRMHLAAEFVPRFGIATECGWGRRDPGSIEALLALHVEALGG